MRRELLEIRRAELERLLQTSTPGVRFDEHIDAPAFLVFEHACE
jgi:hypothetical protein